ncbi:sensor domain-containing diguanylate cyclase [Desulfovibrio inopinatus]|uniref:sensor domain-containing diguanylate cyclase n=1 Tax=Desulfovibrio inopinatus TaxID=102109 RepID=UPI00040E4307|nr:sensor domain-containing diguanylate cyclase [Desulfovibrio inopinatus]
MHVLSRLFEALWKLQSQRSFRLAFFLSSILFFSFFITSIINYNLARESIRQDILQSSLPLTRDTIFSEILQNLMKPIYVSSSMANDAFLIDWASSGEKDISKIKKYLDSIKLKYGFFTTFFISSRSHNYYYYGGSLKKITRIDDHDKWYYDFIASGKEFDLDVDVNQANNNLLTIFINFRVQNKKGHLVGVTGVGLKFDTVSRLLEETQERFGRSIYFIDLHGYIVARAKSFRHAVPSIQNIAGIAPFANEILRIQTQPIDFEYDEDGNHYLLTARYIPELNWILIVEENESKALAFARYNFQRTLFIGLFASLFVLFVSGYMTYRFQKKLFDLATTDDLTGLSNRREFERQFKLAVKRFDHDQRPFSVILADIDGMKQVNDKFGHLAGDTVLVETAQLLRNGVRPDDHVARWGGDEFIILAQCDREEAKRIAERIRSGIEGQEFSDNNSPHFSLFTHVTMSQGVAEFHPGDTIDSITMRADALLYQCKNEGKNNVCVEGEDVPTQ